MVVSRALVVSGVRRCGIGPTDHHPPYDHLPNTRFCLCAAVNQHPVTRILKDQWSGIADIGFTVARGVFDYFTKEDFEALPQVLRGHFLQWSSRCVLELEQVGGVLPISCLCEDGPHLQGLYTLCTHLYKRLYTVDFVTRERRLGSSPGCRQVTHSVL